MSSPDIWSALTDLSTLEHTFEPILAVATLAMRTVPGMVIREEAKKARLSDEADTTPEGHLNIMQLIPFALKYAVPTYVTLQATKIVPAIVEQLSVNHDPTSLVIPVALLAALGYQVEEAIRQPIKAYRNAKGLSKKIADRNEKNDANMHAHLHDFQKESARNKESAERTAKVNNEKADQLDIASAEPYLTTARIEAYNWRVTATDPKAMKKLRKEKRVVFGFDPEIHAFQIENEARTHIQQANFHIPMNKFTEASDKALIRMGYIIEDGHIVGWEAPKREVPQGEETALGRLKKRYIQREE